MKKNVHKIYDKNVAMFSFSTYHDRKLRKLERLNMIEAQEPIN